MSDTLERPRSISRLYKDLWYFAEGKRGAIVLAFALLLSSQMLKLLAPWFAGKAINALQSGGLGGLEEAGKWLAGVFAVTAGSWTLHGPGRIVERNIAIRVRERVAGSLLDKLLDAPLAWHEQHHSGESAHRLQQSSRALHDFVQSQFIYLQNIVQIIGPVLALFAISPVIGTAAVIGYGALGLIILLFDRVMMKLALAENNAERRYSANLVDMLGNVLTLIALRRGKGAAALTGARLRDTFTPVKRSIVLNEAKWCVVDVLSTLMWCFLVALFAYLQAVGKVSTAGVAASGVAIGSLFMVYEYSQKAGGVLTAVAAHFQSLVRQQSDYAAAEPIYTAPSQPTQPYAQGSDWKTLRLEHLQFFHANSHKATPALDNVGFTLERGKRYALVGGSGAGKTTLLRLLCGLDTPAAGQASADGAPVMDIARFMREQSTLIPQQAETFAGTVGENLLLGGSATTTAIQTALTVASADAFLPDVSETGMGIRVAEGGANWSGGQRQRFALARGVLAAEGSSIVLLDEPMSSLDPETEARVYASLFAHFADAVVISSIHRLHLLDRFDRVIFLSKGRLAGCGSMAELLEQSEEFHLLLAGQTGAGGHQGLDAR
jgi:ATP-binding cassette subfamily B protein